MQWEYPPLTQYSTGGAPEYNLKRRLTGILRRLDEISKGESEPESAPEVDPYEEMVSLQDAIAQHEEIYDKRIASKSGTIKLAFSLAGLLGVLAVIALVSPAGGLATVILFLVNLIPMLFFLMSASGMLSEREDLVEEKTRVLRRGAKDLDKATAKFLASEGVSTPGVTPEILKEFDM